MKRDSPSRRAGDLDEAARWLARRDRGLTATEQAEFDAWMARPENARALAELESPFHALDRASALRPAAGGPPDPDLLLRTEGGRARRVRPALAVSAGLAAAAALVLIALPSVRDSDPAVPGSHVVRHGPERQVLPDGSAVDIKPGSRIETAFTPTERRIVLRDGQAHFEVQKDPDRPFIVVVGGVAVRAVGTAFTVAASSATVEVVVTEGRVRIDDPAGRSLIQAAEAPATVDDAAGGPKPAALNAGESVRIDVGQGTPAPAPVVPATADVLERSSSWRTVWLEFSEMPLAEVAREFNRHARENRQTRLEVADAGTGRILVSGTFRADGTDAFVRLLKSSFGVQGMPQADGTVRLARAP